MVSASTILLIDDEPAVLFAVGEYFREHGLEVDSAADAAEARRSLTARTYRLVVADLMLAPNQLDPLEVVRDIRRAQPASRIVVLTGCDTPSVLQQALELGAFAFVQKPVPLSQLLEVARRALADPSLAS